MLENFHKETFEEQLNTPFLIVHQDLAPISLELTSVEGKGVQGMQEQFSLLFRGPLEAPLEQGLHPFEHVQLGQFELFIVPVARTDEGFEYEAIFNRLLDEDSI